MNNITFFLKGKMMHMNRVTPHPVDLEWFSTGFVSLQRVAVLPAPGPTAGKSVPYVRNRVMWCCLTDWSRRVEGEHCNNTKPVENWHIFNEILWRKIDERFPPNSLISTVLAVLLLYLIEKNNFRSYEKYFFPRWWKRPLELSGESVCSDDTVSPKRVHFRCVSI